MLNDLIYGIEVESGELVEVVLNEFGILLLVMGHLMVVVVGELKLGVRLYVKDHYSRHYNYGNDHISAYQHH